MRIIVTSLIALAACGRPYECGEAAPQGAELTMISPGATVSGPWAPVIAEVAARDADGRVVTCLDGAPVDDPLGLVRQRRGLYGGGWDYVGALDLVPVSEGAHDLWVVVQRGTGLAVGRSVFTVERGAHRVDLDVRDGQGQPVAARVLVTDGDDVPVAVVSLSPTIDPSERDLAVHSVFAPDGTATLWLDSGTWRFRAVRGVLWTVGMAEVALDADATVPIVVEPAIDLPGYLAADLHVHTGHSYDSIVPDLLRYESLAAGGLDVVVVTDHNQVVDPRPAIDVALPQRTALRGVPGVEADLRRPGGTEQPEWDLGHMNAYPVTDGVALPPLEVDPVGQALGAYRQRQQVAPYPGVGSEVVLQLNHPRGIQYWPQVEPNRESWPLFEVMGFDRTVPPGQGSNAWMTAPDPATGATALDFDALELVNRFSWALYLDVRRDWFALLDAGVVLTGTGNSDSHALEIETAGLPVNLVAVPPPPPGEDLDIGAFVAAIRGGRVIVSTGPVVELSVASGANTAVPGERLVPDGPIEATIRVRAAPWVPVPEARLVVDGLVVARWAIPASQTGIDATFTAAVPSGGWVIAEAGWPLEDAPESRLGTTYPLVAPAHRPIGFTNPVFLDQ